MSKLMRQLAEEGRKARQERAKLKLGRSPGFVRYWYLDEPPDTVMATVNSYNAEALQEAANGLVEGMAWDRTIEGEDFWLWVHIRLCFYRDRA